MPALYKYILIFGLSISVTFAQTEAPDMPDSVSTKSPGKALLFSTIPGGGQLYNESPGKALLFAGAFAFFTYEYLRIDNIYQDDPSDQLMHRSRNDQIWLMALTWVLNIADAYVEAQLWDFDEYDINDQSLSEEEMVKPKETEEVHDKE